MVSSTATALAEAARDSAKAWLRSAQLICRKLKSAFSSQHSDRTCGRFWGQEIIAAACVQATDEDYMSDEDTVAMVTTGPRGKEGFDNVLAERLSTEQQASQTSCDRAGAAQKLLHA